MTDERKAMLGFAFALLVLLVVGAFLFHSASALALGAGGALLALMAGLAYAQLRREIARRLRVEEELRLARGERDRTGKALGESEQRYSDLLESTEEIRITHDLQGTILTANRAFYRLLGYDRAQEIVGRPLSEFLAPEARASFPALLEKLTREGHLRERLRVVNRFGEVRVLDWSMALRREEPAAPFVQCVAQDVTAREGAESTARVTGEQLDGALRELEQRNLEITRLSRMTEMLQSCQNAEEAYQVITYAVQQMFPPVRGLLGVLDHTQSTVNAQAVWGDPPGEHAFAREDCHALRRGQAYVTEDAAHTPPCKHLTPHGPQVSLCVPLVAQGEMLGVLVMLFPGDTRTGAARLPASTQRLATAMAEQIALSLANLRLRETLHNQSIRDPLTGLFNRRYMEDALEREIRRAARAKRPLAVLMLDLDHFKRFNDTFGHDAGDTLLRELAAFFGSHIRSEDIACRYGGEEFAFIFPEASLEAARERAEHLRKAVRSLQVHHRNQALGSITLSVGVAAFPTHGKSVEILIRVADQALYRAKREGRDRVVVGQATDAGGPPLATE